MVDKKGRKLPHIPRQRTDEYDAQPLGTAGGEESVAGARVPASMEESFLMGVVERARRWSTTLKKQKKAKLGALALYASPDLAKTVGWSSGRQRQEDALRELLSGHDLVDVSLPPVLIQSGAQALGLLVFAKQGSEDAHRLVFDFRPSADDPNVALRATVRVPSCSGPVTDPGLCSAPTAGRLYQTNGHGPMHEALLYKGGESGRVPGDLCDALATIQSPPLPYGTFEPLNAAQMRAITSYIDFRLG